MKSVLKVAVALAAIGLLAAPAMANVTFYFNNAQMTSNLQVTIPGYAASNTVSHNGGAFNVRVVTGAIAPSPAIAVGQPAVLPTTTGYISGLVGDLDSSSGQLFNTFCVEPKTTNLNTNGTVRYVATIDTYAVDGDGGASSSGHDDLSAASAWIYRNYLAGNLASSYNNKQISEALWMLEGDGNSVVDSGGSLAGAIQLRDAALAASTGLGGVRVLNLWTLGWNNTSRRWDALDIQSQLVQIPVPGAALLALIGLPIVGWVKRRFA